MPYENLGQWDFRNKHVQPEDLARGENFVSSESIVVCALNWGNEGSLDPGNPVGGDDLIPIGVLENATVVQNKQLQQIFEIGSRIPFFIPGRTYIQVNLARVLFNGSSLMAILYADRDDSAWADTPDAPGGTYVDEGNVAQYKYYANLASSFFNKPTSLAFIINDSEDEPTGAMVLRDAYLQNYQLSVTGQQTIVLENATMRCARIESLSIST
jgi:hypothetical protein